MGKLIVKSSVKVSVAEWLERNAGKQGVAGSIPVGGIYFNFVFFASRRSPYK